LIALYWQAGTPVKIPGKRLTPQDLLSAGQFDLVDSIFREMSPSIIGQDGRLAEIAPGKL
jgi:hypothetical protein